MLYSSISSFCEIGLNIKKYEKENSNIKIYTANWENDFSKARNYAKSFATNNWILFLDADERLTPELLEL